MSTQSTVHTTVVFADLMGSTGLYEATGNASAARTVTRLTDWMSEILTQHQGHIVKTLGDGVLATFKSSSQAIDAVVEIQRRHQKHFSGNNTSLQMPIRIGIANGEVEIVAGDCFGDPVNVAARLSDLTGGHQIWVASSVLFELEEAPDVRFRPLGPIAIRGRVEACNVTQVDWRLNELSDFLTIQGDIETLQPHGDDALGTKIELVCLDQKRVFHAFELPIQIGRSTTVEFVINDPRVSREHARIEWRNGSPALVDVSSYGSWLRFSDSTSEMLLRRNDCALHGSGEIALGAPFADISVPTVSFKVS